MIDTPYSALAQVLDRSRGYLPSWASRRSVHRTDAGTVYVAEPQWLNEWSFRDFMKLIELGWSVTVDGARLGRMRVKITRAPEITQEGRQDD